MEKKYLTTESVTEGHPDKLCDKIADAILDACLTHDSNSRVACEVLATKGNIIVAGEITCGIKLGIRNIVKDVLYSVGYNPSDFRIQVKVHQQSPDIADGVGRGIDTGAGDQGIMYGYATDETPEYLPLPVVLANRITARLTEVYKNGTVKGIKPDGKSQVTIEYENGKPKRIKTIVVSVQHDENKTLTDLTHDIKKYVLFDACENFPFDSETEILINPSGRFVLGGPAADTGLTGRKLGVDTYGGLVSHGGGAFSGKDPTKVDRSGAYMCRYVAKNIVAAGLAKECLVSVAYAIGKPDPVMIDVDTKGTGKIPDRIIGNIIRNYFDFRPKGIIMELGLKSIYYSDFCNNCHFMHPDAPWERIDSVGVISEKVEVK